MYKTDTSFCIFQVNSLCCFTEKKCIFLLNLRGEYNHFQQATETHLHPATRTVSEAYLWCCPDFQREKVKSQSSVSLRTKVLLVVLLNSPLKTSLSCLEGAGSTHYSYFKGRGLWLKRQILPKKLPHTILFLTLTLLAFSYNTPLWVIFCFRPVSAGWLFPTNSCIWTSSVSILCSILGLHPNPEWLGRNWNLRSMTIAMRHWTSCLAFLQNKVWRALIRVFSPL